MQRCLPTASDALTIATPPLTVRPGYIFCPARLRRDGYASRERPRHTTDARSEGTA
jgi:hypothetical protein